uniref:Uncharacterized protein n=1 Tax=Mola mola TaxID=94237 RepID=A0A3Q4BYS6_MOLML
MVARVNKLSFKYNMFSHILFSSQEVAGEDVVLPSDEIWLERREITGDKPPELLGSCGSHVNSTLYIFAGRDSTRYTNEMFSVDLSEQHYSWKRVSDTKGTTPSPRNKHSCWVHRDRGRGGSGAYLSIFGQRRGHPGQVASSSQDTYRDKQPSTLTFTPTGNLE